MYAEKLYKNGKFYTMEQEGQAVEAVGVRDGKIVFTGTNEEAEKIESDEIIDIKGRAVFPGFIDCHQHTLAYARTTKEVNLVGTKSVQDILDRPSSLASSSSNTGSPVGFPSKSTRTKSSSVS